MKSLNINAIVLAISLIFATSAIAEGMSKQDYQNGKHKITADYKSARVVCAELTGTQNDICVIDAKGKEKVAIAELEASYRSSPKAHYEVHIARAEATYAMARQRCKDMSISADIDICMKEAKAVKTIAKADAKAQMKTSDANDIAREKSAEARSEAKIKSADARKDAADDKREAQYGVAKEKCSSLMNGAKDRCMDQAKVRLGM